MEIGMRNEVIEIHVSEDYYSDVKWTLVRLSSWKAKHILCCLRTLMLKKQKLLSDLEHINNEVEDKLKHQVVLKITSINFSLIIVTSVYIYLHII